MKSLPIWMSLLTIVLGIPLAMRKVPLNGLYGFRTPKTMSSVSTWYAANHQAGINLIVAGALTLAIWSVIRVTTGMGKANFIGFPVYLICLLGSVVVSFVQLRKL